MDLVRTLVMPESSPAIVGIDLIQHCALVLSLPTTFNAIVRH